jgi:hypothetical protein
MSDVDEPGSTHPHPGAAPEPASGTAPDRQAPELQAPETGAPELQAPETEAPGAPQYAAPSGGYSWTSSTAPSAAPWAIEPPPEPERPRRWRVNKPELVWAAIWTAIPAALGVPLAFLWVVLGPHVDVVMTTPGNPDLADYNTEAFVAGDGRFALITAVTGVVLGATAWLLRRGRGPLVVVGLALGSLAGAWITWKLGTRQGADEFTHLVTTAKAGQHFQQNMRLRATGLVYLQALAAVAVYVGCAAWSRYPDLTPAQPPEAGEPVYAQENVRS